MYGTYINEFIQLFTHRFAPVDILIEGLSGHGTSIRIQFPADKALNEVVGIRLENGEVARAICRILLQR